MKYDDNVARVLEVVQLMGFIVVSDIEDNGGTASVLYPGPILYRD